MGAVVVGGLCLPVVGVLGYSKRGAPLYAEARVLWLVPGGLLAAYGLAVACGLWPSPSPRPMRGARALVYGAIWVVIGMALVAPGMRHVTGDDRWLVLIVPSAACLAVVAFTGALLGRLAVPGGPRPDPISWRDRLAFLVCAPLLVLVAVACAGTVVGGPLS